ncbi:hypothetical protein [Phenylobacterium deserti]|uniref:DUF3617 domain-containing protein n=1 Tax=Phenylobacterium deserti TaxID=1914756 RepID=A0A328ACE4_9CAUL|nr:hypothetical protein [Phenylobacterium deserti]RAK52275.1 hypothetical protein DJ018_14130 [Phenylobacterium deserti]
MSLRLLLAFTALAAPATALSQDRATAWRLIRTPAGQVWAAQADITAAPEKPGGPKEVRQLTRGPWLQPRLPSDWTITRVRYECGKDRFRTLQAEQFTLAGQRKSRRGGPSGPIEPETLAATIYGMACNGASLGDAPRADDLAAVFRAEYLSDPAPPATPAP